MAAKTSTIFLDTINKHAGHAEWQTRRKASIYYFGNGCFWGRQKNFADIEQSSLGRSIPTALAGYAGGQEPQQANSVCYHGGQDYSVLGHAEVVAVIVDNPELQLPSLAETYFKSFVQTPEGGVDRPDPLDTGRAYRNIIGIPGGFGNVHVGQLLEEAKQKAGCSVLELKPGQGQDADTFGRNIVWVLDSTEFPFFRAEQAHQFHDHVPSETEQPFPEKYLVDLRNKVCSAGLIPPVSDCQDCHTSDTPSCCSMAKPSSGIAEIPWTLAEGASDNTTVTIAQQLPCKTLELLRSWHKLDDTELRSMLQEKIEHGHAQELSFEVTQRAVTESPERNKYAHHTLAGIYVDVVTGEPLFSSDDKFDSGTGWPSFSKPMDGVHLVENVEAVGDHRVEVRSLVGNSHLGHVFTDGVSRNSPTEYRYCINSAALDFIPAEEATAQEYQKLCTCKGYDVAPSVVGGHRDEVLRSVCMESSAIHKGHLELWVLILSLLVSNILSALGSRNVNCLC